MQDSIRVCISDNALRVKESLRNGSSDKKLSHPFLIGKVHYFEIDLTLIFVNKRLLNLIRFHNDWVLHRRHLYLTHVCNTIRKHAYLF